MSGPTNRSEGLVTEAVRQLITKQIDDHSLVVWYDSEGHYRTVARDFNLPKTTIALYDGSFLQLRREIDPLLNDQHPPRLLVYVPMDQGETDHALDRTRSGGRRGPARSAAPQPQHPALPRRPQCPATPSW